MENGEKQQSAMWLALGIAWELGYLIVVPLVVVGLTGAYADKQFGTSPLFLLIGIVIAFSATSIGVYRKIKKITDSMNNIQ